MLVNVTLNFNIFMISKNDEWGETNDSAKDLPKPGKSTWQKVGGITVEFLKTILLVAALALIIRYFVVQPFVVEGASMEPTYLNSDYLLVEKVTLYFKSPERGTVIIFKAPNSPDVSYIKRIIGLPGEKVIVKDRKVMIYNNEHPNGIILNESYLPADTLTSGDKEITLSSGEYFVMGDNRENSSDSREWGLITKKEIQGEAWLIVYPFSRFGVQPKVNFAS